MEGIALIEYVSSLESIREDMLRGFFVGWPNPPANQTFLRILKGSYAVWLAVDSGAQRVAGFITAISDGVMSAYIPLLEVLPAYQKTGIGKELLRRMLERLGHLYMVDLVCDASLQGYYEKLGMRTATGMVLRNYDRQSCE